MRNLFHKSGIIVFLILSQILFSQPTTVPAAPTMAATDVISIYSDSYTDIATNYNPGWGQSGAVNTTYITAGDAANNVLVYTNFNYQGTEMPATDASSMDFLHVDVWVTAGTDRLLKVTPVNTGGTGTNDILVNVPLTPGAWNSVNIPKSDFTGMTWDNIIQLKFDGQFNGDGSAQAAGFDVYLDNIYFGKNANTSLVPLTVPPAPTMAAADVISIYSDSYTDVATLYNPGWGQSGTVDETFDPLGDGSNYVLAYNNMNYQGTILTAGTDASLMEHLHIDIWVPAGQVEMIKVTPINDSNGGTGAGEFLVEVPVTPGAWNSVDLPKTAFTGQTWDNLKEFKFERFNADGTAGGGAVDVYLDNVYFYRTVSTSLTPTDVAAAPTVDAANVISVYSDAYTDVATLYNPGWGQSGTVDETFDPLGDGSNYVLAYNNMNYQGTILTAGTDASLMEHLHIDIWVPAGQVEMIKVTPINDSNGGTGAGEFLVEVPVTPGAWNSVDLPKTAFTGQTWDNLKEFKFERFNADGTAGGGAVDVYLDNVYFYRTVSTSLTPTDVAAAPTVDAANVISVYSDAYTDVATLYNPGWGQSGTVDETFDPLGDGSNYVLAYNNMNYQGTILTAGTDASLMEHLHIDIWVPAGQVEMIKVTPINDSNGGTGAGEFLVEVPVTPGAWNSVDLPKTAFTGQTWDNLKEFKFERFNADGTAGGGAVDVYLDNVYFYRTVSTSLTPTDVAAAPTVDAANVISVYSDAYTDVATLYNPGWGQSGTVDETFDPLGDGSNYVLAYNNMNYQGTILTAGTDASLMEHLHIDIWVPAGQVEMIKVTPINDSNGGTGAGEFLVEVPVTPGAWNSVDLPKTAFTGQTWDNLKEFKFERFNADGTAGGGAVDVYLDNIFFWRQIYPTTSLVVNDFNTIESATNSGTGALWTNYDETDNANNYSNLSQLPADQVPNHDSPVMVSDYSVFGHESWGGYTADFQKFDTPLDFTGYNYLSFKFNNYEVPAGPGADGLSFRVVLWDISDVTGDYQSRADVETWFAFFAGTDSPFANTAEDGWVEYRIPIIANGNGQTSYSDGFTNWGTTVGVGIAGNNVFDVDQIGGIAIEVVMGGQDLTAAGGFMIEDIQAIYSQDIPGCMTQTACNYNPEATIDDGSCYECIDVTLNVDMSEEATVHPDGVYLAGGGFGQDGHLMADTDGDGVWSVTLEIPESSVGDTMTYKFRNQPSFGTWDGFEDPSGLVLGGCNSGAYNDRFFKVPMADSTIAAVCYGSCYSCDYVPETVDISFAVNMADVDVDPAGVWLAGGSFGGNPGHLMADSDNDDVWTITLPAPPGVDITYKFVNGPITADWQGAWEIVPAECAVGDGADRGYTVPSANAAVDTVCFSSCSNCIDNYALDVTFNVDMNGVTGFTAGTDVPYVFGSYNDWTGQQDVLSDADSDGVYTGTVSGFMFNDSVTVLFGYGSNYETLPANCGTYDSDLVLNVRPLPLRDAQGALTLVLEAVPYGNCPVDLTRPFDDAPEPTLASANVISVYSDSYTSVSTEYNPGWSQAGTVNAGFDPTGLGVNYVLHYSNMNYQGTLLQPGTDASGMNSLHIDIWVPVGQDEMIKVTPINDGNGGTGENEFLVEVPVTPGAWNSVDLPKSAFTGQTWDNLHQMKFERYNADGTDGGDNVDIYLDNIYFWNDPTILSNEDESFSIIPEVFSSKAYPNPFNPYVNISYELPNSENVTVNIVNLLGQNVKTLVNSIHSPGSYTYTWNGKDEKGLDVNSGMYFAIINYESGRSILKITYLK